jgi:AraC family transcriptional regulator, regulatory protein of adaptative response / methylated-DNA-[protein]-cysteine methyltransferase
MMTHRTFIQLYPAHVLDPSKPYNYGLADTPYGYATVISRDGYLLALGFTDSLSDLKPTSWPKADWHEDNQMATSFWQDIANKKSVKVVLLGTDFQRQVWQALLDLKEDQIVTYQELAQACGRPKAYRAVANAVGANPISFLVPCHQVVRTDGGLGGYRWGTHLKKAMLKGSTNGHI